MPSPRNAAIFDRVERWKTHRDKLRAALETAGWDGDYYRRGYFDDGTPLGSSSSEECQIDSLGQSWSVLSGEGEADRSQQAMNAVMSKLVDEDLGIIRLFTPAFSRTPHNPGYIKGYPPGVRENGGQYTHAATWVVLALAKLGRSEDAWKCFSMLSPVNHALNREASETYRVEPYVVTADVYGENAYAVAAAGAGTRALPACSTVRRSKAFSASPVTAASCISRLRCRKPGMVSPSR